MSYLFNPVTYTSSTHASNVYTIDGTSGNDYITLDYVDADGESMEQAYNDQISYATVFAGDGDDTVRAMSPTIRLDHPQIYLGAGNDDLLYYMTNGDAFYGEDGDDILHVVGRNEGEDITYVSGGNGNDFIQANTTNSIGDINLNGGDGQDSFYVMSSTNSNVTVTIEDFELGIDTLIMFGDTIDASNFVGGFHLDANPGFFVDRFDIAVDEDGGLALYFSNDAASDLLEREIGTEYVLSGITLEEFEASFNTLQFNDAELSVALIGTSRNDDNGLKESGAVHLGNGIYLTDSRFTITDGGLGLDNDTTFIHGYGTDNEQESFVVGEDIANRYARDLDRSGSDEIAMIKTNRDAGSQIGMVIYADPNEAHGDFTTIAYSRSENGEVMRQYDISISEDAYQDITLKNRDESNDVWVTDGLTIPTDMLGGAQGSGVFQEIDGQEYLAGILVGPYLPGTDQAFVVDAVGDNYSALANQMLRYGDADDYATNMLIASSDGGRFAGSGLNEILQGSDSNDTLIGLAGSDELIDGAGSDLLRGGDDADVFVFVDDGERDVIVDFDLTEDLIDLSAFGVTFDDLVFNDVASNGNVRIDIGDDRFIINNGDSSVDLTSAEFTEDLFIF